LFSCCSEQEKGSALLFSAARKRRPGKWQGKDRSAGPISDSIRHGPEYLSEPCSCSSPAAGCLPFPRDAAYSLCLHGTTPLLTKEKKSLFWRPTHSVLWLCPLLRSWLVVVQLLKKWQRVFSASAKLVQYSTVLTVTFSHSTHCGHHPAGPQPHTQRVGITKWQAPFRYCPMTKVTVTGLRDKFPCSEVHLCLQISTLCYIKRDT
jgi:hypothetical protein